MNNKDLQAEPVSSFRTHPHSGRDLQTTFEAFAQGVGLSLNRLSSDFHDFESNETYTCYIIFSAGWESCQSCIINQCKEMIESLDSIEGKTNEQ